MFCAICKKYYFGSVYDIALLSFISKGNTLTCLGSCSVFVINNLTASSYLVPSPISITNYYCTLDYNLIYTRLHAYRHVLSVCYRML